MNFVTPDKRKHKYVLGIDFGHGETSAEVCEIQWEDTSGVLKTSEPIEILKGKKAIPTVLTVEQQTDCNGELEDYYYIGYAAVEACKTAIRRNKKDKITFYEGFKKAPRLASEQEKIIMQLFMGEVYKYILKAWPELQPGNHVVYIACPSNAKLWNEECKQEYAQMALKAGLPLAKISDKDSHDESIGIIRESRAAYLYARNKFENTNDIEKGFLLIDFGSSTVDLTYYAKDLEAPIDFGWNCGASNIERTILEQIRTNHPELPDDNRNFIRYYIREKKEDFYSAAYRDPIFEIRLGLREYSGNIKDTGRIDEDYNSNDIDNILGEYYTQIEKLFIKFRDDKLQGRSIAVLMLTGGASRMGFVADIAKKVFDYNGVIVRDTDPSITVSRGIAFAGRADMRILEMKQQLLGNKVFEEKIAEIVIVKSVKELAVKIRDLVEAEISQFADNVNYGTDTIAGLVEIINKKRDDALYGKIFQDSFYKICTESINKSIKDELSDVVKNYFPAYILPAIDMENLSLNIRLELNFDQLGALIADWLDKNLPKLTISLILGMVVGFFLGLLPGLFVGVSIFKSDDNELSEKRKEELYKKYANKVLDASMKMKLKDSFQNNKDKFYRSLRDKLLKQLKADENLNRDINEAYKQRLTNYVIEQINRVRFMLN